MNHAGTSRREAMLGAAGLAAATIIAANNTASAASGVGGINGALFVPELVAASFVS